MVQGYGLGNAGLPEVWSNPAIPVSKHFTIHDAIWLHQWGRLATHEDGLTPRIKTLLYDFFRGPAEKVRDYLTYTMVGKYPLAQGWEAKMDVHCCYRPEKYNFLRTIGGSKTSAHMCLGPWVGLDFHVVGFESPSQCLEIRKLLIPKLEEFGIRMENREGNWIHIDNKSVPPGSKNRYFIP